MYVTYSTNKAGNLKQIGSLGDTITDVFDGLPIQGRQYRLQKIG